MTGTFQHLSDTHLLSHHYPHPLRGHGRLRFGEGIGYHAIATAAYCNDPPAAVDGNRGGCGDALDGYAEQRRDAGGLRPRAVGRLAARRDNPPASFNGELWAHR